MKVHTLAGLLAVLVAASSMFVAGVARADNPCGSGTYPFPYTDVAAVGDAFCPGILESYVTGITKGTTATTFGPDEDVTRTQMTTFLQRTLDQSVLRLGRRAALGQWWTPKAVGPLQTLQFADPTYACVADGQNIWIAHGGSVAQVLAASGKVMQTWSVSQALSSLFYLDGKVYGVSSSDTPGQLYMLDTYGSPGAMTVVASNLNGSPTSMAFDGTHLWASSQSGGVSMITPQASAPYPVTSITTGLGTTEGMVFDGNNLWVVDITADTLVKLDGSGNVLQSVPVGGGPFYPVFDGANIWVPNIGDDSLTVVTAASGAVVSTITSDSTNHLSGPWTVAFDGQRVLVTNSDNGSVTVFDPVTLKTTANVPLGASTAPQGACSDGINFWVELDAANRVVRF